MAVPYTDAERAEGQRMMIAEGIFSRAMEGVTGGVILAAFALALGASDIVIGLLAAIPFLAQLAHVPAVALLARFPDRKPMTVWLCGLARLLFFVLALLPFTTIPVPPLVILTGFLVTYTLMGMLSGAAWQVWVRELVPRESMGRYFGRRMAILSTVGLVTLLAAGQFLSWSEGNPLFPGLTRFTVLFVLGGLLGCVSTYLLTRAPSLPAPMPATPHSVHEALKRPFGDGNFRRLLLFLGTWGFAANLALPFVTVVLLRTLGYGLGVVTLLAAASQVANIVGFRLWAPLTDRFGNKPVLYLAASTFLLAILTWVALPKVQSPWVLGGITFVHLALGLATAGIDLASSNVVMKLAPDDDTPAYLASASVVKAVATGIAPLLGGLVAALLSDTSFLLQLGFAQGEEANLVTALRIAHYDFLFLAAGILGLYALHRLLGFEEVGEAPPEAVVRAMRRDVGQLSSIGGMRQFAHMASYVVETAYRFEAAVGVKPTRRAPLAGPKPPPPDPKTR
ncbi:MAG TPA: MFS transporter [Candidatus Thermoplasmatota archaeon]|nr:MFS transporter [Candidatus Thermoplasmatota archaeon]